MSVNSTCSRTCASSSDRMNHVRVRVSGHVDLGAHSPCVIWSFWTYGWHLMLPLKPYGQPWDVETLHEHVKWSNSGRVRERGLLVFSKDWHVHLMCRRLWAWNQRGRKRLWLSVKLGTGQSFSSVPWFQVCWSHVLWTCTLMKKWSSQSQVMPVCISQAIMSPMRITMTLKPQMIISRILSSLSSIKEE